MLNMNKAQKKVSFHGKNFISLNILMLRHRLVLTIYNEYIQMVGKPMCYRVPGPHNEYKAGLYVHKIGENIFICPEKTL